MKKNLLIAILALLSVLCLTFGLAGCFNVPSGPDNSGTIGSEEQGGPNNNQGGEDDNATKKYTVTYNANGGEFADGEIFIQEVEENSLLTAPIQPKRASYIFGGWAKDKNGKNLWQFATDKVTDNLTLFAIWQEPSASILSVEGASIEGDQILMIVPFETENVSLSNKVICSSDSSWKLYYDKMGQTEIPTRIAANINGSLANGDNEFYIVVTSANQSQVNTYKLIVHRQYNVNVNYYDNKNNFLKSQTVLTGEMFTTKFTPDIAGYTFNYWQDKNGNKYEPVVIFAGFSLYANTTVKTYKITLNVDGGDELSTTEKTVTYDEAYNLPKPTRTGYSFLGWGNSNGNIMFTDDNGAGLEIWTGTSDITLYAKWQINQYKITLNKNLESGGSVSGDGEFNYGTTHTITATAYKGYIWLGWYKDGQLVTMDFSHQFTLGAANETYTAKFKSDEALENFIFTSTQDTCTITGLKDYSVNTIIIPDCVTEIKSSVFKSCTNLESITLPFVGRSKNATTASSSTLFGYVFGTSSYTGSTATQQYYDSSSSVTYYIPNSLKSVTITGGNILYGAFYNCTSLTSITIPNSVTSIGSYAFCHCYNLTSITIPDSVTSIGWGAFMGCKSLTSITIPNSVTIIGERAFYGCINLTSITIPNSVTSIGSSAFYGCTSLKSVYITDLKAWCSIAFADSWGNPLYYAHNLYLNDNLVTNITADMLQGVTEIKGCAFSGCTSLTSVTIGNSVTSIGGYAFSGCTNLTSITVDENNAAYSGQNGILYNKDKTQFIHIPQAIKGEVVIPNGISSIGESAFRGCTNLESVTIPDSVTSIDKWAFGSCESLTSVTIGNGVTSIEESAFSGCTNIINATMPALAIDTIPQSSLQTVVITSGDSIGDEAFYGCTGLTSITIPDSVTSIGSGAFSDCTAEIKWGDNPTIQTLGDYTFSGYKGTSIEIPNSVTSIGRYAFSGCTSLTSITIGSGVTDIGDHAFYGCYKLVEVINLSDLPIKKGESSYGYAAYYAVNVYNDENHVGKFTTTEAGYRLYVDGETVYLLGYVGNDTQLQLPENFNGKNYKIYNCAFEGCTSLTSITIPNSVTFIGRYAFEDCTSLTGVYITDLKAWCNIEFGGDYANPLYLSHNLYLNNNLVTEITADMLQGVTEIKKCAFEGCTSLTSVTIPDSVTSIGNGAFEYCTSLKSVYITDLKAWCNIEFGGYYANPLYYAHNLYLNDNLVTEITADMLQDVTEIKKCAFAGFGGTSITIPNSVTSIGFKAFYNCTSLTSITIPDSVTSIGSEAFHYCYKLVEVINLSNLPIQKGESSYGYVAYYALNVYNNENYVSKFTTTEAGYRLYVDGETVYLLEYVGNDTQLQLPNNFNGKNYEIYNCAFEGCTSLTSITIPNGVTSIGRYAFRNCTSLTNVNIGNGVTSIGSYAFGYCTSLTSITIPNSVTSIGSYAFGYCTSLESVSIGNGVTSIGEYAFEDCTAEIKWGDNPTIQTLGDYTFYGYKGASIEIPNSVTSIGNYAFSGCTNLESITIPDSVTSIGGWAFYKCTSLTSVTIGNSVTSIGESAFEYCTNLTSIIIPASVTSIGSYAFIGCTSLKSVTFKNTTGWKVSQNSDMSNATTVSVTDPADNAQDLTGIYYSYYWKRG